MGNVNAREDGNGSPTEVEEEGGGQSGQEDMAAPDVVGAVHGGYHVQGVSSEVMGLSPLTSPKATQSPLIFIPQVPVVPLQRPDDMDVPSRSWMQTTSGYEDMCSEEEFQQ